MVAVRFTATREEHIAGFHACVDAVARERLYLGFVEGPPLATSQEFVRQVIAGGGIHTVALDARGEVIGWCDIVRDPREGFRHSGRLGMGLLPSFRGAGLGHGLAETAIHAAWERGLERIALEVFASNTRAISLYDRLGFRREGVRRRARKLDGQYDDEVLMALVRDSTRRTEVQPSPA